MKHGYFGLATATPIYPQSVHRWHDNTREFFADTRVTRAMVQAEDDLEKIVDDNHDYSVRHLVKK